MSVATATLATNAVDQLPPDQYFVDPVMGYKVEKATARLMMAFAALAFVIFGLGAVAALMVVLTRMPAVKLLPPYWFYIALTYHGVLMLTMWVHMFESVLWIYTSTVLLKQKMYGLKWGWVAFGLVTAGIAMVLGAIATGQASVMYTVYVPLRAHLLFYIGHVVYAVGLLLVLGLFGLNLVKARVDGTFTGTIPLLTMGMATANIITVVALISAVAAFVPAILWALGIWVDRMDPLTFKLAFWGMGHTLQYTNIVAMVVAWYAIVAFALRAGSTNDKFSRYAFMLYFFFTLPVYAHHFLVDPVWSPAYKWFGATLVGILLGIPSSIHGIAVPAAAEVKLRQMYGDKGWFGFLRRWGWGDPAMIALFFSLVMFGIGGFDGTIGTTLQLNAFLHNTMWMPAHFHGALAGGTAVGFMGLSWYLLPALGIKIPFKKIWGQVYAYMAGIGFMVLIAAMHWAAYLGVPRRTATITYSEFADLVPNWFLPMNVLGVGGVLAVTGVLLFVVMMLTALYRAIFPEVVVPRPELAPVPEPSGAAAD